MGEWWTMNILELMKKRESIREEQKNFLITDIVFRSKIIECFYQNSKIENFQFNEDKNNYELIVENNSSWNGGSELAVVFYFTKEEVLKKLEYYKTDDEDDSSYIYKLKLEEFEIEFWVDIRYF